MKTVEYFKYWVKLDPCCRAVNGNFIITMDGNIKEVTLPEFDFYSYEQLTEEEVKSRIKGTKYTFISGDFKDETCKKVPENVIEVNAPHVKYSKEVWDFIEANSDINVDSNGVKTYKLNKKYIVW